MSNLEAGRNVGFENVVRVAMALGRVKELEALFLPKLDSIEDIRRYESSANRLRTKRGNPAMLEEVNVFYEGWGERWQWGTLASTTALIGRPLIVFEYSNEAKSKGLELSSYRLPLAGPRLRRDFPDYQLQLPGPCL